MSVNTNILTNANKFESYYITRQDVVNGLSSIAGSISSFGNLSSIFTYPTTANFSTINAQVANMNTQNVQTLLSMSTTARLAPDLQPYGAPPMLAVQNGSGIATAALEVAGLKVINSLNANTSQSLQINNQGITVLPTGQANGVNLVTYSAAGSNYNLNNIANIAGNISSIGISSSNIRMPTLAFSNVGNSWNIQYPPLFDLRTHGSATAQSNTIGVGSTNSIYIGSNALSQGLWFYNDTISATVQTTGAGYFTPYLSDQSNSCLTYGSPIYVPDSNARTMRIGYSGWYNKQSPSDALVFGVDFTGQSIGGTFTNVNQNSLPYSFMLLNRNE